MTKLASVTLVSVFGVIVAAVASMCILDHKYLWTHYLSIFICICGVVLTIYSDLFDDQGNLDLGNFWGDLIAILGSSSYAISSVICE